MASKNNKPVRKTAGKSGNRKPKKPKVKISNSKALLCASIIFAVCGVLLSVSVLVSGNTGYDSKKTEKEISHESEKPAQPEVKKTETSKPVKKNTETVNSNSKKTDSKNQAVPQNPAKPQLPAEEIFPDNPPLILPELEPFPIPDPVGNPVITFVFDDGGHNLKQLQKILELPFPVSVAVLPKLAYSKECARRVRASGKQLLLHQPMETLGNNATPGEGAIMSNMSGQEARNVLLENISEIAPVAGINNHEGSKISENQFLMEAVLMELKKQNIFYLDSRTTSQTRAPQAALELGMEIFERDIFLDNIKTRENILKEIEKGVRIANIKGKSIMLGHVWSADILPEILEEVVPLLMLKGYRIEVLNK